MTPRPSWHGFLNFKLLSMPVKGYPANAPNEGKVSFHMLHAPCKSRIQYKKVCPIHGEVPNDEIVSGYEVSKGEYAIVEAEERKKLKQEDDKGIDIDVFVRAEEIDPIYYAGKSYYLVPDGRVGEKTFTVLQQVMAETGRCAVARVVLSGRPQVGVLRAENKILVLSLMNYQSQMRSATPIEEEAPTITPSSEERELAEHLVKLSTAKHFDFSKYEDQYTHRLTRLIESKHAVKGKAARRDGKEEPAVINLMDALRRSLQGQAPKTTSRKRAPGTRKRAQSHRHKSTTARKKTG